MGQERNRIFDFGRLEEVTGGDREFEQELLEEFLTDTPNVFLRLSQAVTSGDFQRLQMECHALKGSSLSLGADALGSIAADMEMVARTGRGDGASDLLQDIEMEFERVRTAIRERLLRAA